jgi:hypothetical protein
LTIERVTLYDATGTSVTTYHLTGDQTVKDYILKIATTHTNDIAKQRAKRILRLRYGMKLQLRENRDPVWLTAHN